MSTPRPLGRPGGHAELVLATFVLATIAMLVVVLPTWLLDGLLAANIALSVGILVVVLYARESLALAAFPSLLLLTTLFRLALNVSSSRLILLQADAGAVIRAFGGFVVRGNMLVGAVVFAVLTVVQFVVIAKGAERIAEVGARFSLDALPGKQLAIDAELRAGVLTGDEARERRKALGRQSEFYGAMDGAMKFVKGDVIATVVIVIVNVVFGLVVGVAQRGLTVEQAASKYVLLAIGDGLVSQVPALVLSTAAGILVTRTASDGADGSLGDDLAAQLFSSPRALTTTGVFVLALGLVPGLPAAPFLVLATAAFMAARRLATRAPLTPAPPRRFVPVVTPFAVLLGPEAYSKLATPLGPALEALRDRVFADLGLPLPVVEVKLGPSLGPNEVVLSLFEVPAAHLDASGRTPEPEPAALVAEIVARAEALARARGPELLGVSEVQGLLDALSERAPSAVRAAVPKPVSLQLLTEVLRRLLEEQIPVRDLPAILDVLAARVATESDPLALTEAVRAHLRRTVTFRLTNGAPQLAVVMVDALVEDAVRRGITKQGGHTFLALPPAQTRDIVTSLKRAIGEARDAGARPVVLSSPDIRRYLRKLLDVEAPDVPVVSHGELQPELALQPLARAHLGGIG